jgi:hypothetical protein
MPKLRNINPMGQVDVPVLRRQGEPFGEEGAGCLEPGEVFEVDAETAKRLLEQVDNYELVKPPKKRATKKTVPAKKAVAAPAAESTEQTEV